MCPSPLARVYCLFWLLRQWHGRPLILHPIPRQERKQGDGSFELQLSFVEFLDWFNSLKMDKGHRVNTISYKLAAKMKCGSIPLRAPAHLTQVTHGERHG